MKKLWAWLIGSLYGLLTISSLGYSSYHNFQSDSNKLKIRNITENTPLYLEQYVPQQNNQLDSMLSWHYSHASHYSHYSHESHRSHYSHYSHYSSR